MSDTFRKVYTPLTEEQKSAVDDIKSMAENLETILIACVPVDERSDRGRLMNIARTNLETAIMYAVKAVTSPK